MISTSTAACRVGFYTVGDSDTPSTWFRVLQYFPGLESSGWTVRHFGLSTPTGGRWAKAAGLFWQGAQRFTQLQHAKEFDVLFVQKGLTQWRCRGLIKLVELSGKPFILDLDDAIHVAVDHASIQLPGFFKKLQNHFEPLELIRRANHVIVGNPFLATFVSEHNPRCTVIPTTIDTKRYFPKAQSPKTRLTVGWSGTTGTNIYVNRLTPILQVLAKKHEFKFVVVSNDLSQINQNAIRGIPFEFIPWSRKTEVEGLSQIDIGTMPLPDDDWARGKCGFKALLYMALGIPPVCSPVGVNTEIIQDGVNGFLAATNEEWVEKLTRLMEDPELRRRMGVEARKTVEEKYSVETNLPKLMEVIQGVI